MIQTNIEGIQGFIVEWLNLDDDFVDFYCLNIDSLKGGSLYLNFQNY